MLFFFFIKVFTIDMFKYKFKMYNKLVAIKPGMWVEAYA